ncbi:MAG: cobalamin-binding protein [Candidatus Obscuribacterales bacterium]|nr:cobalamin-binding protein [Candidatus Obscuribacterales bacterium]
MRIVSLIASSTEIVWALGLGSSMVGRSHECDYPEAVLSLPVCTSPKFNVDGRSYMIDERVRAILQESLSVYRVDSTLLNSLHPTHIITQSQCEVCAVSLKDVEAAACELMDSKPQIISLEPNSLADIYADIERIGGALDLMPEAQKLSGRIKSEFELISKKSQSLKSRPRVALIEWIDPLMAAGNWMPELLELAGAESLLGQAAKHSSVMLWKDLLDADPDFIIVSPCGFNMQSTLADMPLLTEKMGWHELRAVKAGQVYIADGNQYFNRPGPRILESLQILSEILHPQAFHFGHEGKAWKKFSAN